MNKLQEINDEHNYNSRATSFSKLIIFIFFASTVYTVITTSNEIEWWKLIIFLIVGLLASSIVIAMPFFILKRILRPLSIILTILAIIATFFATQYCFNWLFDEPKMEETAALPNEFSDDKKLFEDSLTKFLETSEITNGADRNATKEEDKKVLKLTLESIESAEKVSDEFLNHLHKDLKYNYHEKFLKSERLYYEGLSQLKSTDTLASESVQKQIEAGKLMDEWIDWWGAHDTEILDKMYK